MDRNADDEDLMRRIERLERGYHKWRRTGLSAIGVVIALLAFSAYTYAQRPRPAEVPGQVAEPAKLDGVPVVIDKVGMRMTYTNFFQITGCPDEVILDVGFYSQVTTPTGVEPARMSDRMVMDFYTAKKLLTAIQTVVTRHEDAFGEIQVDPNKRLRPKGDR